MFKLRIAKTAAHLHSKDTIKLSINFGKYFPTSQKVQLYIVQKTFKS